MIYITYNWNMSSLMSLQPLNVNQHYRKGERPTNVTHIAYLQCHFAPLCTIWVITRTFHRRRPSDTFQILFPLPTKTSTKSTFDSRENRQRHIGTSHGTTSHLGGWMLVGEDTASFNGNEKLQSFNGYVWRLPVTSSIVEGLPGHRNTSVSIHRKTLSCCTTVWQRWDLGDVDHFLHKRQQTYPPTWVGVV